VQQHIPEWSATSGIVRFMDEMPLTSEGRINKSVLIGREIQAIYEREVNALDGIASVDVGVGPDLRYGVAASISVVPGNGESLEQIKARIHEVLGRYPIAYEVVVEQAPDGYLLENMQSELES
jgi:hypothetical protein